MRKFENFSIQTVTALPRFGSEDRIEIGGQAYMVLPHPGSISLYINIPFCRTICRFCMLRKAAKISEDVPQSFVDLLKSELKQRAKTFRENDVASIYFGGGTPSLLNGIQVADIINTIFKYYSISSEIEISIEGEAHSFNNIHFLKSLKGSNINRISFGLQTMDQNMRTFLGRTDSLTDVFSLKKKLDKIGFDDVNVDYLYNLPGTDTHFIEKDIRMVLDLGFDSIDCHPLKYISCSSNMLTDIVKLNLTLPDMNERISMFWIMRNMILEQMNEQFVDQYTKTDVNLTNLYIRHLNGLDGGQYAGFGPGSRSHYGDYGLMNARTNHEYFNGVSEYGNAVEMMCHSTQIDNYITRLPKRNDFIDTATVNKSVYAEHFIRILNDLSNLEYLKIKDNKFSLTELGLSWYQNLQEVLLVPSQLERHIESTNIRAEKLKKYNDFFDTIGNNFYA